MPKPTEDALDKYKAKVRAAKRAGYSEDEIIDELKRERATVYPRCVMKQATLAMDRNIYKKREAARAAQECLKAIDQLIDELSKRSLFS